MRIEVNYNFRVPIHAPTAYNGETLNVALADVPEKKTDLVADVYELDAPAGETTVAVKVTDMLGEEVLKVYLV